MLNYNALLDLIASLDDKRYKVAETLFYSIYPGQIFGSSQETIFIEFWGSSSAKSQDGQAALIAGRAFRNKVKGNPLQHLKFHISLDNTGKDDPSSDFCHGYKVILSILIKHRVMLYKVVKPGIEIAKVNPEQAGKDITVYCRHNPEYNLRNWILILQEIHTALIDEEIKPGIKPRIEQSPLDIGRFDKLIPGTNFITYRLEKGLDPTRGALQLISSPPPEDKEQKKVREDHCTPSSISKP